MVRAGRRSCSMPMVDSCALAGSTTQLRHWSGSYQRRRASGADRLGAAHRPELPESGPFAPEAVTITSTVATTLESAENRELRAPAAAQRLRSRPALTG